MRTIINYIRERVLWYRFRKACMAEAKRAAHSMRLRGDLPWGRL